MIVTVSPPARCEKEWEAAYAHTGVADEEVRRRLNRRTESVCSGRDGSRQPGCVTLELVPRRQPMTSPTAALPPDRVGISDSDANHARRWWILAVLGVAQLMVILDNTIVNIALP